MREELLQKLHSLQERKRLMCSRSTKIREVELKRKIINDVLEIVPKTSATATCLRAIEFEVNKQDITLRPWKQRKLKSMDSTNKTLLSTASSDKNIHLTLSKQDEYKEELKNRRPVWLFQAKERWEAKSNM
ncbi:unnamed protein product [Schistosoma bovis]|nr:unnamed protein product [Schistosoma bovis]